MGSWMRKEVRLSGQGYMREESKWIHYSLVLEDAGYWDSSSGEISNMWGSTLSVFVHDNPVLIPCIRELSNVRMLWSVNRREMCQLILILVHQNHQEGHCCTERQKVTLETCSQRANEKSLFMVCFALWGAVALSVKWLWSAIRPAKWCITNTPSKWSHCGQGSCFRMSQSSWCVLGGRWDTTDLDSQSVRVGGLIRFACLTSQTIKIHPARPYGGADNGYLAWAFLPYGIQLWHETVERKRAHHMPWQIVPKISLSSY